VDFLPIPEIDGRDESGKPAWKEESSAASVESACEENLSRWLDERADRVQVSQAVLPALFIISEVRDVDGEQCHRYAIECRLVSLDKIDRLGQPVAIMDGLPNRIFDDLP
jgi:hypothetical protein